MSEARKTILVIGATGGQGGSVAHNLLLDKGRFSVRCLTRNAQSEKARTLASAGAEVVQGSLDDPPSLRAALAGCWGLFGVTNYWEHFAREFDHGKNLVDAVAASDVKHFVFSTLPSVTKATDGELEAPHLDIKAQLQEYTQAAGLPATFAHVAFYYENFLTFFPPQKQPDGTFMFGFPQGDTPLAAVAVEDVGGVVAPIFADPDAFIGKTVGIVGDDEPCDTYAQVMARVLGMTVRYSHIPREVFAGFGFPGADDLANMFDFNRRFIPNRAADLAESRRLYPQIRTFETWLQANKDGVLSRMQR